MNLNLFKFNPSKAVQDVGLFIPDPKDLVKIQEDGLRLWSSDTYRALRELSKKVCAKITGSPELRDFDMRGPWFRANDSKIWHHDCGGGSRYILVWATESPTEIRESSGLIYRAIPYMVTLLNNRLVEHRAPPSAYRKENNRWFAVARMDYDQRYIR